MCPFPLILTVDQSLGRVDFGSLSDQMLMEMLIEGLTEESKKAYQDAHGMFLDVCVWPGVSCNEEEQVVRMQNVSRGEGTLFLSNLPPNMTDFVSLSAQLSGTLETSALPQTMQEFCIGFNNFHGTVDFSSFPANLRSIDIHRNEFSGSVNLENLPQSMTNIGINENKFSGTLCFKRLPPNLQILCISENAFTGDFHLENIPESLFIFDAWSNAFNPTAVVPRDVDYLHLSRSGVTKVLDEKGETHPNECGFI